MERIPIISNPKMFDAAVAEIQKHLGNNIQWLNHIFGIVEPITRYINGKKVTVATVFAGDEQYVQIEPCVELGDFCYFVLKDPQSIDTKDKERIKSPFCAVFWYDMRKVSSEPNYRNREAVKAQILGVLNSLHLTGGKVEFTKVYETPSKIFQEFDYDHTQNQCLMSPYAGIRIEGEITTTIPCYD